MSMWCKNIICPTSLVPTEFDKFHLGQHKNLIFNVLNFSEHSWALATFVQSPNHHFISRINQKPKLQQFLWFCNLAKLISLSESSFLQKWFYSWKLARDSESMKRLLRYSTIGGIRGYAVQSGKGHNVQNLKIEGIKDIIAVASGKGGVGKSTTAVNLAVSLANKCHLKVGLLDADVYGPSIPMMMKLHGKPEVSADKKMIPIENYGVKCMSMGSLVAEGEALVWRGPMVMKALEQMTRGVHWGTLDILVVDMPPGTGDAQISISQRLQLSGALIVSTPQDVALMDARRGVKMFSQVHVPILGILENMSYFKCPKCSEPYYIFGKGGAQRTADEMDMEFLGEVPLETGIRSGSDEGVPVVISDPDSFVSRAYGDVAQKIIRKLELTRQQNLGPEINL